MQKNLSTTVVVGRLLGYTHLTLDSLEAAPLVGSGLFDLSPDPRLLRLVPISRTVYTSASEDKVTGILYTLPDGEFEAKRLP